MLLLHLVPLLLLRLSVPLLLLRLRPRHLRADTGLLLLPAYPLSLNLLLARVDRPLLLDRLHRRRRDAAFGGDGAGCERLCRLPVILGKELLAILSRFLPKLDLRGHGRGTLLMQYGKLTWVGMRLQASVSTVVGDASHVVHHHIPLINVVDVRNVHMIDGAVVVEVIAIPIAPAVAQAGVAIPVVDAAIEADVAGPEAVMEAVPIALVPPVARSPERAGIGCRDPCPGNPEVSLRGIVPVAGGPEIIGLRSGRLIVDRKRRRRLVRLFDCVVTRSHSGVIPWLAPVGVLWLCRLLLWILLLRVLLLRVLLGALLRRVGLLLAQDANIRGANDRGGGRISQRSQIGVRRIDAVRIVVDDRRLVRLRRTAVATG